MVGFTGSLAFPFLYPWPQRPEGLIEEAFDELGRRWLPILQHYSDHGQDLGFEIHPGEDVFDGATWEMFLDSVGEHAAAKINYDPSHFLLQQLDYLAFIDLYHERINAFHVKHGFKPVLLIDDLFFGIDNKNLSTVVKLLVHSKGNIVLTAPNIYKEILEKICEEYQELKLIAVGEMVE